MQRTKRVLTAIGKIVDIPLSPILAVVAIWLRFIRTLGVYHFRVSEWILKKSKVFPIRDHYYEPLVYPERHLDRVRPRRTLSGIDFRVDEQKSFIENLMHKDELLQMPDSSDPTSVRYYLTNGHFGPGDGEFLYSLIRTIRPKKIIEIGSGYSSLAAKEALDKNGQEDDSLKGKHICIEPYEMPWLENNIDQVVRKRVEEVPLEMFQSLEPNDILFIDSSHVIRPRGDVLFEFLEILPVLKPGVYVHVHDVFSPYDYPNRWVFDEKRLWNEQYLLEVMLMSNPKFEVIASLHLLYQEHLEWMHRQFPNLRKLTQNQAPCSFWIRTK